jgi:hypothetical protein
MRMGVGAVGGIIDQDITGSTVQAEADASPSPSASKKHGMWEDWGNRIEVWPAVRAVADRAVGHAVATRSSTSGSLAPIPVEWSAIDKAWEGHRVSRNVRKAWMKEASSASRSAREQEEDEDEDEESESEDEEVDEVVDRLKNDEDLDPHEQRLLGCIVNSGGRFIWMVFFHLLTNGSHYAHFIQSSSSAPPHDRLNTHDCVASSVTSTGLPAGHFKGPWDDWMSSFRPSGHR